MWNALTSSSNFVLESLETFAESTGVAGLIANMGWGSLIMICVAFFLLYLAIKHKFEPLLLLTIAFGMLLTNLPGANLYHTELFAGGHVHWDIFVAQPGRGVPDAEDASAWAPVCHVDVVGAPVAVEDAHAPCMHDHSLKMSSVTSRCCRPSGCTP